MPPKPPEPTFIDLNILPEQYRPRVVPPMIMLLWTIAGVLLAAVLGAFVFVQVNGARARGLEAQLEQAQNRLATIRTPDPTLVALADELERSVLAVSELQTIQPTLAAGQRGWRLIFDTILINDPQRVQLTEMLQDRDELTLKGIALSQDDVLAYAGELDRSGVFLQVIPQSMQAGPHPFVTPRATLTQTAVLTQTTQPTPGSTLTPTPSLYDVYEIDDFQPGAIAVGQVQWHNFNPAYDADQVTFLGKANRRYCVLALPQAIGVDTYLEVSLSGVSLTNDDCRPNSVQLASCQCPTGTITATAASMVEVQVPAGADQQVRVRVSNRGQYGPRNWYTLLVTEASGDPWERDDDAPKPIAVGEVQARTFDPAGDVDRVTFAVKAGHAYDVRTSALVLGADTLLTVTANGVTYSSDDIAPGDRASRVLLDAAADAVASVRVANKGQYGPAMGYTLEVLEMGGDAFESDDYTPKPLSPWEQQRHSFFPAGDVDRVQCNVKAGRIYELKTYSLTVGVDTVLAVLVQGILYQNDDVRPGDASSRVVFAATADGVAGVTVTNREQYGTNKEYWLTLRELTGSPTPELTGAPGTPGPTGTPACSGDVLEPDDAVGRIIVVLQDYQRAFCPSGDVDRAVFTAKAGYSYQVDTDSLALGVDTYLTVQIGGTTLSNDDRSPQDLRSRVIIQNVTGTDSPAFVTIVNKGLFGNDKTYKLKVSDAGAGDVYEVDNTSGVPIAMGASQSRTFYPPGDVDRVYFAAKANHRYRIYTTIPASGSGSVGVDTVLAVDMGATHLQNDDRLPGDLSSYVELQNYGASDSQAMVTITNKGQYAANASYTIQVDDLGAESGDAYEPDLTEKRYISVGEVQAHSFHPEFDIDRVFLMVKAGRSYAISTCGGVVVLPTPTPMPTLAECGALAPGVDTVLMVAGPIANCAPANCQNDDALPGSGSLGSLVSFQALIDGEVTISVYNKGLFGPSMGYAIMVQEIGALPPTPVGPTATPYYSPTPTLTQTPAPPSTYTPTLAATSGGPSPTTASTAYPLMEATAGQRRGLSAVQWQPGARAVQRAQVTGDQVIMFVLLLKLRPTTP